MAPRDDEADLFQHTSMTFGEHLEELRSSLFKAVISLVIGFAIGLAFGGYIVEWIQKPLTDALEADMQRDAMAKINPLLPPELRDNETISDIVYKERLLPEIRYLSPDTLLNSPPAAKSESSPGTPAAETSPASPAPSATAEGKAAASPPAPAKRHAFTRNDMVRTIIWRPLEDDERLKLDTLSVMEPFVIYMKASFLFGAVLSSPFVFYFLWQFVAAGLYPHEKHYVHLFLPVSLGLFLSGALLAFFFVFPPVLGYFFWIGDSLGTNMRPRLNEWLSFVLLLPLGFGVAFQLPLVMLFLERIRVCSVQLYVSKWKVAVLLMAIAAMVLSPGGDPYSMMMMLAPLIGLYFLGIGLCNWLPSRRPDETLKPKKPQYAEVD